MLTPTEGCFAAWTRVNHFFQIVNSKRNQAAAQVTPHQGQPETSQPRQGPSFKARLRDARGVAAWTVRVLRHAEPLLFHDNGYWIIQAIDSIRTVFNFFQPVQSTIFLLHPDS